MADTTFFNRILDEKTVIDTLPKNVRYYIHHIQEDEIKNTPDETRMLQLLERFEVVEQEEILTESTGWNVSKWEKAKITRDNLAERLLERIQEMDKKKKKKKKIENQTRDALIADTCIKRNITLITEDGTLLEVMKEFGGQAITLKEFLKDHEHAGLLLSC